jgi:hypothetical protein
MNTISQCCKASVSPDLKREGIEWSVTKVINVCNKCKEECEVSKQ